MAELTFFFDRCFASSFPKWLRAGKGLPFVVEYHDEKKHGFQQNTPDDEWLSAVGAQKWVVFSLDKRFHRDSMAMEAVKQHKVACFYMDGGNFTPWERLILLARTYVRVRDIIKNTRPPYIYRIMHNGRVILVRGGW